MASEQKRDKIKKRKRDGAEEEKSDSKVVVDSETQNTKKSKGKDGRAHPGYFVMSAEPAVASSGAGDDSGDEEKPKLLPEDKKEISDMLDEIEERKRKKREKRALRKTQPPAPKAPTEKENAGEASIQYVKEWQSSRSTWKFKSAREAWLIRNWKDTTLVPEDVFKILVTYFESMKGARRDLLRKEAKAFTKKYKKETDDYKTARESDDSQAILYRRSKAIRKALRSDDE